MSDLGYEWENLSKRYVETQERKASLCGEIVGYTAASQWYLGRSLQQTYEDLCAGWYGGTSRNAAVHPIAITSKHAQSWIKTAEDFMDEWITKSLVLDENLEDFQVNGSVDAVDVYEDHVVSDDDDSDACFEDEQED